MLTPKIHPLLHDLTIRHPLMIPGLHRPSSLRLKDTTRNTTSLKQMINILQLQLIRLREETVNDRNPESAEHGEDDKSTPADVVDCYGCYLDDGEYAHYNLVSISFPSQRMQ
jgi:hypothetical protein